MAHKRGRIRASIAHGDGGIGLTFKLKAGLLFEPDHHRRWGNKKKYDVPGTTDTEESTTEGTCKDELQYIQPGEPCQLGFVILGDATRVVTFTCICDSLPQRDLVDRDGERSTLTPRLRHGR